MLTFLIHSELHYVADVFRVYIFLMAGILSEHVTFNTDY